MRQIVLFLLPFALSVSVNAQIRPSVAIQVYPAGQIAVIQVSSTWDSPFEAGFHAGYNRTRRRDWGVHENESGGGAGAGMSLRRFVHPDSRTWFYGLRVDFWSLEIDWYDTRPECSGTTSDCRISGDSRTFVVQPTLQAGYRFRPSGHPVDLTLAFGREINVRTRGQAAGEGTILLAGVSIAF